MRGQGQERLARGVGDAGLSAMTVAAIAAWLTYKATGRR